MKFVMTPAEVASAAAVTAIGTSIKTLESGIKDLGELSAKEAKQSDEAKAYFAEQARAYATAIKMLAAWRTELAARASIKE